MMPRSPHALISPDPLPVLNGVLMQIHRIGFYLELMDKAPSPDDKNRLLAGLLPSMRQACLEAQNTLYGLGEQP